MKSWISNGHSLYCSDFAYSVIESCFPQYIDFYGNDSIDPYIGSPMRTTAYINSKELREHLGKDKVEIIFDLGGWVVIDSLEKGSDAQIWVTADSVRAGNEKMLNVPIMIYFSYNQGKVLYTSFHNEAQVTDDMLKILIRIIYGL